MALSHQNASAQLGGIQAHSVGGLYPYIIEAQETPNGLRYVVSKAGEPLQHAFASYGSAAQQAAIYKHLDFVSGGWKRDIDAAGRVRDYKLAQADKLRADALREFEATRNAIVEKLVRGGV